jgi:hypothetical protein
MKENLEAMTDLQKLKLTTSACTVQWNTQQDKVPRTTTWSAACFVAETILALQLRRPRHDVTMSRCHDVTMSRCHDVTMPISWSIALATRRSKAIARQHHPTAF